MLTRRLTLAVFATLFATSSSLAMLQNARPASADPDDHWRRHEHHRRVDRDDHWRHRQAHFGNRHAWHPRYAHPAYVIPAYVNNGYVYSNGYGYVYNGYANPGYYTTTVPYYVPQSTYGYYATNRSWNPNGAWRHRHHPDRDDRRWRGHHYGWNNAHNPHDAAYHWSGKPHIDAWRDHHSRR